MAEVVAGMIIASYKRKLLELIAARPDLSKDQLLQIAKDNQRDYASKALSYIQREQRMGRGGDSESDVQQMLDEFSKTWNFPI